MILELARRIVTIAVPSNTQQHLITLEMILRKLKWLSLIGRESIIMFLQVYLEFSLMRQQSRKTGVTWQQSNNPIFKTARTFSGFVNTIGRSSRSLRTRKWYRPTALKKTRWSTGQLGRKCWAPTRAAVPMTRNAVEEASVTTSTWRTRHLRKRQWQGHQELF